LARSSRVASAEASAGGSTQGHDHTRPGAPGPAEAVHTQTASPIDPNTNQRLEATPLREVRVRAVRNGHEYGWIQLPRGTRVELVRDEGRTLVIRYDEVSLRIPRTVAEAGMVVPVRRDQQPLAGL
ncbi:MAG: hypothetical protein ABMA13_17215, partial [Chthoniobacteraceae bacterium]